MTKIRHLVQAFSTDRGDWDDAIAYLDDVIPVTPCHWDDIIPVCTKCLPSTEVPTSKLHLLAILGMAFYRLGAGLCHVGSH